MIFLTNGCYIPFACTQMRDKAGYLYIYIYIYMHVFCTALFVAEYCVHISCSKAFDVLADKIWHDLYVGCFLVSSRVVFRRQPIWISMKPLAPFLHTYFGGLTLALLGISVPVAQVAPASTGNTTPVVDSISITVKSNSDIPTLTCHPPRLIASEKSYRCSHVPSRTLGLEQTPILPCIPCLVAHTARVHHRRVHHPRTNAVDSNPLWCMVHRHCSCHVLSCLVSLD